MASVGALFILLWLVPAAARADQELLASAKSLYESASYEAALSELSAIDSKEYVDVIWRSVAEVIQLDNDIDDTPDLI